MSDTVYHIEVAFLALMQIDASLRHSRKRTIEEIESPLTAVNAWFASSPGSKTSFGGVVSIKNVSASLWQAAISFPRSQKNRFFSVQCLDIISSNASIPVVSPERTPFMRAAFVFENMCEHDMMGCS